MPDRGGAYGEIEWASADVADGDLVVPLAGDVSAAWVRRVRAVMDRLQCPSGVCEAIGVTRKDVKAQGITEGREGDLRHFLDSAVQQANADLAVTPDEESEDGERSERDQRMAEAFRAFGGSPADPE